MLDETSKGLSLHTKYLCGSLDTEYCTCEIVQQQQKTRIELMLYNLIERKTNKTKAHTTRALA